MIKNIIGFIIALLAAFAWIVVAQQLGVEDTMLRTMIGSALATTVFCAFYFAGRRPNAAEVAADAPVDSQVERS